MAELRKQRVADAVWFNENFMVPKKRNETEQKYIKWKRMWKIPFGRIKRQNAIGRCGDDGNGNEKKRRRRGGERDERIHKTDAIKMISARMS